MEAIHAEIDNIKRKGCPAQLAIPVFFLFYGGLTLVFGSIVYIVWQHSNYNKARAASWVCFAIGLFVVFVAVCLLIRELLIKAILRRTHRPIPVGPETPGGVLHTGSGTTSGVQDVQVVFSENEFDNQEDADFESSVRFNQYLLLCMIYHSII